MKVRSVWSGWLLLALQAVCAGSQSPTAPARNAVSAPDAASQVSPAPRFAASTANVIVEENTTLRVLTSTSLRTGHTKEGTALLFALSRDVIVNGVVIIPRGAVLHGTVVRSKHAGKLQGNSELVLELTSLDLEGRSYSLYAYQFQVDGTSKTPVTKDAVAYGAYYGALAGGIVGAKMGDAPGPARAKDMAAGAAAGAGTAAAAVAFSRGPDVSVPAEAEVEFQLAAPFAVVPVSEKEAMRLAEKAHKGDPVLYVRGEAP